MRTNAIRKTKRTRRLYAATNILYLCPLVCRKLKTFVEGTKVLPRKNFEACNDALAGEILHGLDRACLGNLDLERALAEAELEELSRVVLHLRLEDYVLAGDTKIDISFADE